MSSVLLKAGFWLTLGIFLGRLAGFGREILIAMRLGAQSFADIAILMLTVPDFLVNMLVGGALSAVLIPEFKQLPPKQQQLFFIQVSGLMGGLFLLLTFVLFFHAGPLLHWAAPGFSQRAFSLASHYIKPALLVIPLTVLTSITTAYLQSHEKFVMPAFSTLIFNGVLLIGIFFFIHTPAAIYRLGIVIVIGGLVRWISQLIQLPTWQKLYQHDYSWLISISVMKRYLQALSAGGILLILPFVARAIATYQGNGALAIFNYATKLVELPLSVCITVLPILLFPRLAEAYLKDKNSHESRRIFEEGLLFILMLSIAIMISLVWFSQDIARLGFAHGKMSEHAVAMVGDLAAIGFLSLPAQGITSLSNAVFNAQRDTATPLKINFFAFLSFLPIAWLGLKLWGLQGLMSGLTLFYCGVMLSQLIILQKKYQISAFAMMLSWRHVRTLCISAAAFTPIALVTTLYHFSLTFNVVLAVISTFMLLTTAVLTSQKYRTFVFNIFRDKIHD